ncbi:MAG: ABC transporter substrate-binding protein [Chloroflexota bacterium]|nr:ABC transporter substrate-binding protein [Chloroflexota bacterium]
MIRTAWPINTAHFDLHQGAYGLGLYHNYSTLVRWNLADGLKTVVGDLASKWETSPDGKTWTFTIRDGVKFHDGTPLTVADVVASMERVISPPQGIVSPNQSHFMYVKQIKALDDKRVQFVLDSPRGYFLWLLGQDFLVVYSKKELEKNNNDLRKVMIPTGTGPFKYVDYKHGEEVLYVRNPDYWDPKIPYLDGLRLAHVPNLADRGTAVLTGQADLTFGTAVTVWQEAQKRPDRFGVNQIPAGVQVVSINITREPFNDPRVRRAVHLALSRQIISQVYSREQFNEVMRWVMPGNAYTLATQDVEKLPGWRPQKEQDISEAKRLLTDAGFSGGIKDVDFLVPNAAWAAELVAPSVQEQLKRNLNVELKIRLVERALVLPKMREGDYAFALEVQGAPVSDPSLFLTPLFRTGAGNNVARYSNKQVDDLLDKIEAELDQNRRIELVRQLEDILDKEVPSLILFAQSTAPVWAKYVKGLDLENRVKTNWGRLDTAWLDK